MRVPYRASASVGKARCGARLDACTDASYGLRGMSIDPSGQPLGGSRRDALADLVVAILWK